jgi:hypothetical protein
MPSLTEISLLKACVENPKVAHLTQLYLDNVKMQDTPPDEDQSPEDL